MNLNINSINHNNNVRTLPCPLWRSLELMMTWGVTSSLMVKMEKLGHPTVFAKASHWGGNATCNIPCFSADLRSLNCNEKLCHVFLSIGNSPQTAELNTALRSPLYTPGHGPIFHLDEPGWPDQEGRLDLWWIVDRNIGCLTCSISSWSELLSLTSCDMQHNLNWNKLVGEHTTNSRSW